MVRIRPFEGSTATTEPFSWPSAAIASSRTCASSYSTESSLAGSKLLTTCRERYARCAGAAPNATAPHRTRHRRAMAFMKAGLCFIVSLLALGLDFPDRLTFSVSKCCTLAQSEMQSHFPAWQKNTQLSGRTVQDGVLAQTRAEPYTAAARGKPGSAITSAA